MTTAMTVIPDVPSYLMKPEFMAASNSDLMAGLPQGGFPLVGLKGTRFVIKNEGTETVLPSNEITVVMLAAKPNLDKAYYAGKFDPNSTEAKSPDCYSVDGIRPDNSATMKQSAACAGCPMNEFGSGVDASGNPGKGKACKDTKMIALFTNNGVYGFKVPPASLKALGAYIKTLTSRGVAATSCFTLIGFDPNFSYPVLTFNFGGFLTEAQAGIIGQKMHSPEVGAIISTFSAPQVSPAVAAAPIVIPPPPAPEPVVIAVPADPFATMAPAASDPFAAVQAAPAPVEKKVRAVKAVPAPAPAAGEPTDADLAAALGIIL